MTATDDLAVLFDPDLGHSPLLGWGLGMGPARELVSRLHQLSHEIETMSARREIDLPAYVTAMHALVLDLAELTGAPTNGRRHPTHDALLERFGLTRGPS